MAVFASTMCNLTKSGGGGEFSKQGPSLQMLGTGSSVACFGEKTVMERIPQHTGFPGKTSLNSIHGHTAVMDSTQQRSIHTLQLQLRLKGTCGLDSDEPDRTKGAIDNGQSDPSANLVTNELPTTATEGPSLQSTQGKSKHHLNVKIPVATTTLTRKTSCDRVLGGASRLVLFQQLRPGQRRTCLQQISVE